jgi:transaldolase
MKLLLDSAKIEEIKHAMEMWDLDGVTTNPRHIQAAGKPFRKVIEEIAELFAGTDKEASVEVNPHLTEWRDIANTGRELAALSPNFVIKIGLSEGGLKAVRVLSEEGIRVNATLVFTVAQAWHAARAGAYLVSPFLGWKEQFGDPVGSLITDVRTMLDVHNYDTKLLAASIKNAAQIGEVARIGADYVTAGLDVYEQSMGNPYTTYGEKFFQDGWDATPEG